MNRIERAVGGGGALLLLTFFAFACGGEPTKEEIARGCNAGLSCSQLKYMAERYESIGNSSKNMAEKSTSAAGGALSMQAMQAFSAAARCYEVMAQKSCG